MVLVKCLIPGELPITDGITVKSSLTNKVLARHLNPEIPIDPKDRVRLFRCGIQTSSVAGVGLGKSEPILSGNYSTIRRTGRKFRSRNLVGNAEKQRRNADIAIIWIPKAAVGH